MEIEEDVCPNCQMLECTNEIMHMVNNLIEIDPRITIEQAMEYVKMGIMMKANILKEIELEQNESLSERLEGIESIADILDRLVNGDNTLGVYVIE